MLELPHVVVGAAIATKVTNPFLAIPLAFASHFILERVPHWNPHLNTELREAGKISNKTKAIIIIDSTLALVTGTFIASQVLPDYNATVRILLACLASSLPDLVEAPYFFLGIKNQVIEKWIKLQKKIQVDAKPALGLTLQIVTIILAFFWIFS